MFMFIMLLDMMQPYIVYMGGPANNSGYNAEMFSEYSHLQILSSVIPRYSDIVK